MNSYSKPNIIIFMPDEMRGEVITNPTIQMPNVRGLIEEDGVIFTNNFSVNPVCAPSRICTFTGQYPHNGGHRSLYQLLRPGEENLFHILKQKGYEVVWIGRNDLFQENAVRENISKHKGSIRKSIVKVIKKGIKEFGFIRMLKVIQKLRKMEGFHKIPNTPEVRFILSQMGGLNPHSTDSKWFNSFYYGKIPNDLAGHSIDEDFVQTALDYIEEYASSSKKNKKPFCLLVTINDPHPPYQVEEPYFSMYDRSKITSPYPFNLKEEDRKKKPAYASKLHELYRLNEFSEAELREILAVYYGMCTKVDALFGKILQKLKNTGLFESTMINFFADHGDFAGAYGLTEKWPTGMEDTLLNVPLVVKIPNMAPKTSTVVCLTETIDIFPTILETAGIIHPYTHFGKSLLPVLKGEISTHRKVVHAEGGYDTREPQAFEMVADSTTDPIMGIYYHKTNSQKENPHTVCRTTMRRTEKWKLILRSHPDAVEELYDLENDPSEIKNLYTEPEYEKVIQTLKEDMLRWYLATSDNPHYSHKREG